MNELELVNYYNKFNEDKRLKSRHGQVEFITTMKYIHEYLNKGDKIVDIGAGCGAYAIPLSEEGYNVTAVELVKHNLRVIEKKNNKVKTILGNAINLNKIDDNYADLTLLFGPMYHLIDKKSKIKALEEAKRITKENGIIMVAYCMNDYAVITHAFKEKQIIANLEEKLLDENFHIIPKCNDLYSYLRLEDINELNEIVGLKRIKIISPDGPSDYIRPYLNDLSDEEFSLFIKYHLSTCENVYLLGASSHTLDILKKEQ